MKGNKRNKFRTRDLYLDYERGLRTYLGEIPQSTKVGELLYPNSIKYPNWTTPVRVTSIVGDVALAVEAK